jgi:hypothetical protein
MPPEITIVRRKKPRLTLIQRNELLDVIERCFSRWRLPLEFETETSYAFIRQDEDILFILRVRGNALVLEEKKGGGIFPILTKDDVKELRYIIRKTLRDKEDDTGLDIQKSPIPPPFIAPGELEPFYEFFEDDISQLL